MISFDKLRQHIPYFDDRLIADHSTSPSATHSGSHSAEARRYFAYYGIDFSDRSQYGFDGLTHHFGQLRCGDYDIAVHHFELPQADGCCFILHGYFDHCGLYKHLIEYALKRNLSVVAWDLPGHGLSSGERATITRFSEYQLVLKSVLSYFKNRIATPWLAIGQSTGGAILMDFLLSGDDEAATFAKTVLLAPLVRPRGWRWSAISHSLIQLFVTQLRREFSDNSHDDQFKHFLAHRDPLQYRYLPVQWVGALKDWIAHFDALAPAAGIRPLVIQGQNDGTVDWPANIPHIEAKFPETKVCYLTDACHHLVNESSDIRERMFSHIDNYLDMPEG